MSGLNALQLARTQFAFTVSCNIHFSLIWLPKLRGLGEISMIFSLLMHAAGMRNAFMEPGRFFANGNRTGLWTR